MDADNQEWARLLAPTDAVTRMVMALLRALREKGVLSEEELRVLADHSSQELVTEEEARTSWHTPWLPTEELADKVGFRPGMLVLDAGSGFGGPARQIAEDYGCRVIGVDCDPVRVLYAIRQTQRLRLSDQVSFCWTSFENLPFPGRLFNVVWAMESVTRYDTAWLEGVPTGMNPAVFQEFRRVLKSDGRLACQVWIKAPVEHADLLRFLEIQGFTLGELDDCTSRWLECMVDSIGNLRDDDPRRESWRKSHDEMLERGDRVFRFVATPTRE